MCANTAERNKSWYNCCTPEEVGKWLLKMMAPGFRLMAGCRNLNWIPQDVPGDYSRASAADSRRTHDRIEARPGGTGRGPGAADPAAGIELNRCTSGLRELGDDF